MFHTMNSLHFDVETTSHPDNDMSEAELQALDYIDNEMKEAIRTINEKLSNIGIRVVIVV